MQFTYEAMSSDGRVVTDRVDGNTPAEAAEALRADGLTVLRLEAARGGARDERSEALKRRSHGVKSADLVLFTRQLKMLLEAGSALVPALEAVEQQAGKPSVKHLVRKIRRHVEEGGTLTEAFQDHPEVFKPVFCTMVAAGEATATLPETFDRLNELTARQQKTRKTVIGALLYPAILSLMCVAVAGVVIGFVVPRFTELFKNLGSPLPPTTQFLFAVSNYVLDYWPVGAAVLAVLALGFVIALRVERLRLRLDTLLLGVPVIGRIAARLVFARVLRIWAAMLRSHVSLLDTIQHSRTALTNAAFIGLVGKVEEAVAGGGSIGRTLAESGLVEPVVASAIRTGEENGRLSEAVDFVSSWMDHDNAQLIANLTRVVEPTLLAVMGLFVGLVAMSLFIPLFDLATAGG
ncbi:MAG: type II secretion system F family protein [Planctomycetes bacterium]|nr:type II secretion system F family protein [Planctomycetota bacterium]